MAVVLISGCSSGTGLATAAAFADAGDTVFAGTRRPERAAALRSFDVVVVQLDVDDPESVERAVAQVVESGPIDALVNNAGIASFVAVEDTTDAVLHAIFETNLVGPWRLVRVVVPIMRAKGGGRIVNVSSINGQVATPFLGAYSASKFALEAMSEALSLEAAAAGNRCAQQSDEWSPGAPSQDFRIMRLADFKPSPG